MRRALPAAVTVAVVAAGLLAASAAGFFSNGATIVSASLERLEQADDQTLAVAGSGDGRFVVVQTRARNLYADDDPDPVGEYRVGGLFRYELSSGRLRIVANGDRRRSSDDTLLFRGAQNPSVSGDGRYVAFATGEPLVPADVNGAVDVYVRDMEVAAGAPGAYEIVSARAGTDVPASYTPPPPEQDFPGRNLGSDAGRGVAISADGRRVAFRTAAESDLPAAAGTTTPPFQVLVRDRATDETALVTRDRTTGEPAGGAVGTGGAAISADGTTVAWAGRNAPRQARYLNGEATNDDLEHYLWRRVADGAGAETRRILAFSDPDDQACPAGEVFVDSPAASGPCYGPIAPGTAGGGILNQVPAISADGYDVAVLHDANPRGPSAGGIGLDLYATSMRPGRTRKSATVELTREGTGGSAVSAQLDGAAMSGDGRWVALATNRTTFVLPALRQLAPPRGDATRRELYLVDLRERTIEPVLRSQSGGEPNGAVGTGLSIDAAGRRIAFTSGATNLFFGDANGQVDGFSVLRLDAPPETAPEPEPPPPEPEPLPPLVGDTAEAPPGRLRARVLRAQRSGEVRIEVTAPAPGALEAVARGRVPNREGRPAGAARTLASVETRLRRRGKAVVRLRLARSLRTPLRRAEKIEGQTQLTFVGRDGREYARRLSVVFQYRAATAKKRAKRAPKRRSTTTPKRGR